MNKTFLTVFALIGIFLCGAVVGGVVAVRYVRTTAVPRRAAEWQLSSQQWMRIADRLKLTDEQREKIRAIITAYMRDQQTTRKAMQAATEKAHADITAVLTPEQSADYEKIRGRLRDSEKGWQRWYHDQRARYNDTPPAFSGTQQPPPPPRQPPPPPPR